MKPLYLSPAVRRGLGPGLRPGGEKLTERILDLLNLEPNWAVLDAGCGTGSSMAMVAKHGITRIIGLDLDDGLIRTAHRNGKTVIQGDCARLPLVDAFFDVILCECVWNLTSKEQVLAEFARVLKPGGILALSDIYSRTANSSGADSWPVRCCFAGATDLATIERQVVSAGFSLKVLEDNTRLLQKTAAEFVFVHGSLQNFWQEVTGDADLAAAACEAGYAAKPGLFLLIAQRKMV